MCEAIKDTFTTKAEIISALLDQNVFKMPDGRQFYEATEKELEHILYSKTTEDHYC
ncbi:MULTISPECIES: Fur-regulated basic protein FbpA [Bacillaceae]|uniref:Fur-regulated basic protein FbpA n=1 Tax=Bacillaceae TaxID=186817 RepID=UPI000BFBC066|nr:MULTISPECIES: Fur-regulated basic protein FbpA [Bacillaceae]PGT78097.1 Fur-regulated basic protein FbpA [Bacillus sp. AFS040349]UGB32830.1 Fur-regulated basic protein FbpA [Metabacillus sp. B2-18]